MPRCLHLRTAPAALALFMFCAAPARAGTCLVPEPWDVSGVPDCPLLEWAIIDGQLTLPDRGERVWVDAAATLHLGDARARLPEPYASLYRDGRRAPDGGYAFVAAPNPRSQARARQFSALYLATRRLLEASVQPAAVLVQPQAAYVQPSRHLLQQAQARALIDARAEVMALRAAALNAPP